MLVLVLFLCVSLGLGEQSWPRDLGNELADCVDQGGDVDSCSAETLNYIRSIMKDGLPDAKPPVLPMDPLQVKEMKFKFNDVDVQFRDIEVRGLINYKLRESHIDRDRKTWTIVMEIPRLEVTDKYKISGALYNLDLGVSEGAGTFNATNVITTNTAKLGKEGTKLKIESMDLEMEMDKIGISLDCLFPNTPGVCCEDKWKNSCQPTLAKTIHNFINKNGQGFVKDFKPQLSNEIGGFIKNFVERGFNNLEARYMID